MMVTDPVSENGHDRDDVSLAGLIEPLWLHRRLIVVATLAAAVLAAALSAVHYLLQPVRSTASVEFRATFEGARAGKYPNGLPFGPTDVVDPSVLGQVFNTNSIQDFCTLNDFRSAFSVVQRSPELQMIDADFQSRLADPRLTPVERVRILDEYRNQRAAAPVQYALTFVGPAACRTLPPAVTIKVLNDVLLTWAADSEARRGVLKQRIRVLTPNVLDAVMIGKQSLFIRTNLVWANLNRVVSNLAEFEALPGSELIRFGDGRTSLAEIKAKLEDLLRIHLQPLLLSVGAAGDREAVRWVEDSLAAATAEQQSALDRAQASRDALREYSNAVDQPAAPGEGLNRPAPVDRAIIDRLLELSEPNTAFRQEMTRAMVSASLEAVERQSLVNHYKQLLAALKAGAAASPVESEARLSEIVKTAKDLILQFDGLADEWSRVAFRAPSALYRIERTNAVETTRAVPVKRYAPIIALACLVTFLLTVAAALVHTRLWPLIVVSK